MGLVVEARRNKAPVLRAVGERVHTLLDERGERGGGQCWAAMGKVASVLLFIQPTTWGVKSQLYLRYFKLKYLEITGTKHIFLRRVIVLGLQNASIPRHDD